MFQAHLNNILLLTNILLLGSVVFSLTKPWLLEDLTVTAPMRWALFSTTKSSHFYFTNLMKFLVVLFLVILKLLLPLILHAVDSLELALIATHFIAGPKLLLYRLLHGRIFQVVNDACFHETSEHVFCLRKSAGHRQQLLRGYLIISLNAKFLLLLLGHHVEFVGYHRDAPRLSDFIVVPAGC